MRIGGIYKDKELWYVLSPNPLGKGYVCINLRTTQASIHESLPRRHMDSLEYWVAEDIHEWGSVYHMVDNEHSLLHYEDWKVRHYVLSLEDGIVDSIKMEELWKNN